VASAGHRSKPVARRSSGTGGPPSPTRRRSTFFLAAVSCVAGAALFELGVRWLEPQPESRYRYSPATYFAPTPGARYVYRRQEFSVPIQINDFGMRDLPRRLEKPPGGLRVALVGDSFAEALQVPLDSTVARLLEERLHACFPARPLEVLNFGVSGFGAACCAARTKHLAARFHPDLALYLFVANDLLDVVGNDARIYVVEGDSMRLRPVVLGPLRRSARWLTDLAKAHLQAYRFLRFRQQHRAESSRVAAARERGVTGETTELLLDELQWRRFCQALALLRQEAAAAGAPLLLAQATTFGPQMSARLAGLCDALGIPYLDLVGVLAADPGPVSFRIDGHWRARGHWVAASALAPVVCDMLKAREP